LYLNFVILEMDINITTDELILTKFKLLQVTSHNKSISVHLISYKILITD